MEAGPAELEEKYVREVYAELAPHMADPKYRAWPKVRQFVLSQPRHSLVGDVGCGSGKYFSVTERVCWVGVDVCPELLGKAMGRAKRSGLALGDNLCLPFRDELFDALISVSVIHHFTTEERRLRALGELARVLRPGGRLMVYVWAMEQAHRRFAAQDVLVPWHIIRSKPDKSGSVESVAGCETDPEKMIEVDGDAAKLERIMRDTVNIHPPGQPAAAEEAEEDTWTASIQRRLTSFLPASPRLGGRRGTVPCQAPSAQPPPPCLQPPSPASLAPPTPTPTNPAPAMSYRKRDSLVAGMAKLSPMLGRKLAGVIGAKEPEELEAEEFLAALVAEALGDVLREVAEDGERRALALGAARLEERKLSLSPSQDQLADDSLEEPVELPPLREEPQAEEAAQLPAEPRAEAAEEDRAFYRYYHVFKEEELLRLVAQVPGLSVVDSYYDHANWCVVAERI